MSYCYIPLIIVMLSGFIGAVEVAMYGQIPVEPDRYTEFNTGNKAIAHIRSIDYEENVLEPFIHNDLNADEMYQAKDRTPIQLF